MAIRSLPATARVETLDGTPVEKRGSELRLPAREDDIVLVVTDRNRQARIRTDKFVGAGWVVLDIIGLVPLIIDAATQNWYEYRDIGVEELQWMPRPANATKASVGR